MDSCMDISINIMGINIMDMDISMEKRLETNMGIKKSMDMVMETSIMIQINIGISIKMSMDTIMVINQLALPNKTFLLTNTTIQKIFSLILRTQLPIHNIITRTSHPIAHILNKLPTIPSLSKLAIIIMEHPLIQPPTDHLYTLSINTISTSTKMITANTNMISNVTTTTRTISGWATNPIIS